MPQQKIVIPISPKHSKKARLAIAKEVIDHIIERTRDEGLDKNGKTFAPYKSSYKNSLNFKIAGKGNRVDLTLTGEMLDSLKLLKDSKGEIVVGYDKGDKELNGKVEGNLLGTYGQPKKVGPKRDFLGIQKSELKQIEKEYLVDKEELKDKLDEQDLIDKKVNEIVGGRIIFEGDDE